MAVNICISGVAGRMGLRLLALAQEDPEVKVVCALEQRGHLWLDQDVGRVSGLNKSLDVLVTENIPRQSGTQVVLDFTNHLAATGRAEEAARLGIPIVIGTTGLTEDEKKRIAAVAALVPVIHAANYSVGINLLLRLANLVARTLGDKYDVEIVEAHHNQKIDAPSGTALALAESVAGGLKRNLKEVANFGRHGLVGKRPSKEIGIHAVRMGDVVGEHTIYFAAGGERLELTHKASNRDTFAYGAIRAAKWLVLNHKPAGAYSMAQVLGLE